MTAVKERTKMGRPGGLDNPDILELFSESVAKGFTTTQLEEAFNISRRTVFGWKKDPRVKSAALKFVEDRILRITRTTDSKLDSLIGSDKFSALPIEVQFKLLIQLRKEMLGGVLRLQAESGKIDANDINMAMDQMEADPVFAAELQELIDRTSPRAEVA